MEEEERVSILEDDEKLKRLVMEQKYGPSEIIHKEFRFQSMPYFVRSEKCLKMFKVV